MRALVISGGGSRGAFAVGAVDHLVNDRGLTFDLVAGTSTGSLIAPVVALGDVGRLKQVYTSVRTDDVLTALPLVESVWRGNALNDTTPLETLIRSDLTPAAVRRLVEGPTSVVLTTVNLNNGRVVYFYTGPTLRNDDPMTRLVRITDPDEVVRAVQASAHEPVFMPPVQVRPDSSPDAYRNDVAPGLRIEPTDWYTDGGVREIAPVRIAVANGATDVYAIVLSTADPERDETDYGSTGLLNILTRTVDLFTKEITRGDVAAARGLARDDPSVRLHVIQPERRLPGSGLRFVPNEMAHILQLGRERARAVLDADTGGPVIA